MSGSRPAFVYLNGRLVPEGEAFLPTDDRAILFGDGAYETMRSYAGAFFRFPEHLERLHATVQGMGLVLPLEDEDITRGALELILANEVPDARLRLTVTGGRHDGQIRLRRSHPANLILTATRLVPPPVDAYREGVEVVISPWRVHTDSPLPRIKTVNRLMHLMAKEEALERGAYESLFCDEKEGILEGTATNVFFVIEGTLRTESLTGPVLAGVTRDAVLEEARGVGIPVREGRVGREELPRASEAFLTSTTIEILPIRAVDGVPLGEGRPGPVGKKLRSRYRRLVTQETGVELEEVGGDPGP